MFINKGKVQALLSMWRLALNDRVGQVLPQDKEQCTHLEVVDESSMVLKRYDVGAVKTWVHLPKTHSSKV